MIGGAAFGRALIVSVLLVLGVVSTAAAQAGPAGERQMVVPFENTSGSARLYWLAEASAVLLADNLEALGAGVLSRDERVLAFDQLHVPASSALSHATAIRIGELVGASQVIVGSYTVTGDLLTARARPIRLDTGRLLPEVSESAPLADIFEIYGRLARRLVPDSTVTAEAMEQGRPPLAAFEQYIKGLVAQGPTTQEQFFAQALRLSPDFHRARLGLWTAYTAQGVHQRALDAVRQVPATDDLYRRARFLQALSMLELAQYAPAADVLGELNRQKRDPSLVNDLGIVQLRRGSNASLVKASSFFAEAVTLDPADADLFFNLGYAYWLEKDVPAAIQALREVVRRDPADGDAHFVLGVALQASGTVVEAGREKELARQLSSTYAEWEARPGGATSVPRGLERVKNTVDVPSSLRVDGIIVAAGQREQQDQAVFHLDAGKRLLQAERAVDAIAELRRAIYLAPYQSEAHLTLGRAYLRTGRLDDAVDALKISIWSADTNAARLALADVYVQMKNAVAARAEAQTVLRRDPGNLEARRLLERLPAN